MTAVAYYNEHDRNKAAWLRELIRRDLIAPGDVDERSIEDVVPTELTGYRQCHFFAGVGIWSYALRLAGWPDDRPVWTVSCPCQPFSQAGQGKGFADERHLWPSWFHLASQCRPECVFGEQVESDDGITWLDLVWTDMEAAGYAFGPVVVPAAGLGAPHGRHRIWFVAEPDGIGRNLGTKGSRLKAGIDAGARVHGSTDRVGDSRQSRLAGRAGEPGDDGSELPSAQRTGGATCRVADARQQSSRKYRAREGPHQDGPQGQAETTDEHRRRGKPGPANGFWADAEWLPCRDGKARAVRPGSFPLAHGAPARVVRLRGYGDGIVAQAAEAFIRSYMETLR